MNAETIIRVQSGKHRVLALAETEETVKAALVYTAEVLERIANEVHAAETQAELERKAQEKLERKAQEKEA